MKPLDSKVHGTLIRNKDGREIPADEFIVFRPSDNACVPMLNYYLSCLAEQDASGEQIGAVQRLIDRVLVWRQAYPERCHVADVQPGELSDEQAYDNGDAHDRGSGFGE